VKTPPRSRLERVLEELPETDAERELEPPAIETVLREAPFALK
jgi:hypothetical protein